ncbi:hypothetical protein [Proteus mirabilis]|uniref:hypothetical protein n=1 Tax=Proteus mirabilis TaxID=584 RepID=UPI0034D6B2C1
MENVGISLNGHPTSNIHEDGIDEDLSAEYPNIILSHNMDNASLIGKLVDDEDEPEFERLGELCLEGNMENVLTEYTMLPTAAEVVKAAHSHPNIFYM